MSLNVQACSGMKSKRRSTLLVDLRSPFPLPAPTAPLDGAWSNVDL